MKSDALQLHGRFHGPHGGQTSKKQTLSKTCKRTHRRDLRADHSRWDLYAAKQIYGAIEALSRWFQLSACAEQVRVRVQRLHLKRNSQCVLHTGIAPRSQLFSAATATSSPEVSLNKAFELASANSRVDK